MSPPSARQYSPPPPQTTFNNLSFPPFSLPCPPKMADIEPPTFSLGLDFDDESEPQIPTQPHQQQHQPHSSNPVPAHEPSFRLLWDEEDLGPQVMDSEDEEELGPIVMDSEDEEELGSIVMDSDPDPELDPPRILKRLRRGAPAAEESKGKGKEAASVCGENGDDDIEEFSSQEDIAIGAPPSTQHNSLCSSSKLSLRGRGVLTGQSSNHRKTMRREHGLDAPASSSLETGCGGLMFPKLTISPLRRFQLIDSDSDEPSIFEDVSKTKNNNIPSKQQQFGTSEQKGKMPVDEHRKEDLWHDFSPIEKFHVPTPILDEVCNEYFQSLQNKNTAQKTKRVVPTWEKIGCHQDANNNAGLEQCWNTSDPLPPAHHYFFHDDQRIQKLVRTRLPNFSPLGIVNNRGNPQPSESVIDYMGQFNGEGSKQKGTQRNSTEKCSGRGQIKSKRSSAKNAPHASEGWVEPKSSTTILKDAGKRRVHADGQAAGHWYTSSEGKKVYVSRTGQELTGRVAYRHYRKDNGGSRKSKKKTSAKRKKT